MKSFIIEKLQLIKSGEGYFKISILKHGTVEVPCYEIFLFMQEHQPKLYEFLQRYDNNYIHMFEDMDDIGIDYVPAIRDYIDTIIRYRVERNSNN